MPTRWILTLGALACALAVAAGAFGAHALAERLEPARLETWRTGALYLMFAGLGALASGLLARSLDGGGGGGGVALLVGGLIFSGTVFCLALGGPRWLGAVTPVGGLLLIVGFLQLAWAAFRSA